MAQHLEIQINPDALVGPDELDEYGEGLLGETYLEVREGGGGQRNST